MKVLPKIKIMNFQIFNKIQNKLRTKVQNKFDLGNVPSSKSPLIFGYHILYSCYFVTRRIILLAKYRLEYGPLYFKKIYSIDPKKIQYLSKIRDNKWYYYSRILGGHWDQSNKSLKDIELFQAIKQRFQEGKEWEDTEYYQRGLNTINKGKKTWRYNTKEKWDQRIKETESLYYEIKKNGYKFNTEIPSSKRGSAKFDIRTKLEEISVDIGRDGQILSVHGKHRLIIAKLLDIPNVPIIIIKRHKKWMDFRQNLIFYFRNYQSIKQSPVLTHPDLQNIPFKRGDIPYEIIRENISISKGTLLDIGAKIGFFCHKLEDEGFICYALEENQTFFYLLKKLKKVENRGFHIISKSLFEYNKNQELHFDIVLALNGFHKYLETKEKYYDLINFLKRLRSKELILGTWNAKKLRKEDLYKNFNLDQFINFIFENSCLNKVKYIGKTKNGRSLFKFTSENQSS